MNGEHGLEMWVEPVASAMSETADCFGLESGERRACEGLPDGAVGRSISLRGAKHAVWLSVAASKDDAEIIAREMLGFEDGEEVPAEDVVDALGEIANIVAGVVKGAMLHVDEELALGLPESLRSTGDDAGVFTLPFGGRRIAVAVELGART